VEKYGTAGQATGENVIWHMHFACWITNATDTHSEYVTLTAFPLQQWLYKCASCYVIRILPLLFYLNSTTAINMINGITGSDSREISALCTWHHYLPYFQSVTNLPKV